MMEGQELREYYRTLVTCHNELCWLFEKELADPPVRRLLRIFREEMQRVEDEIDEKEAECESIQQLKRKEGEDDESI